MAHPDMRRNRLLKILKKKRFHGIGELKKATGTPHATIYRDLNALEKEGQIRKSHGGVEVLSEKAVIREYDRRMHANVDLKMAIARAALGFVNAGDHVFLDASSTCYFLGRAIMNKNIEGVTIVTNSLHLLSEYRENDSGVRLVSTGGSVDRELCALLGNFTTDFIARIRVAKTFISAAGWSVSDGISTTNDFILGALKAAISAAPERYCLVDSSKFGREYLFKVAQLSAFKAVITDGGLPKQSVRKIKAAGVSLLMEREERA